MDEYAKERDGESLMDELTEYARMAINLSKHPVRVRWRVPSRSDAKAVCFKHIVEQVAIIDLSPLVSWSGDVDDEDGLPFTLCHESAHIKLLWSSWSGIPDYASGSVQVADRWSRLPALVKIEDDADEQARRWMAHAKKHHMEYIRHYADNSEFALYLRCLAESDGR